MRNIQLVLLCFSLYLIPSGALAQFLTPHHSASLAPNTFFLELGGNAKKLSLNYEQLVAHGEYLGATARFGFGAFPGSQQKVEFALPVTVSMLAGAGNLFGELGGGTRVAFRSDLLKTGVQIIPTGILGLRYHPDRRGGVFLKLAYTPWFHSETQTLQHGTGLAMGFGFNR